MSSRKQQKVPLKPWETATTDGLSDPYIRVGRSLFNHPAFIALKPLSQVLYFRMIEQAAGKSVFEFPHSVYSQYCSNDGFNKAKAQLIEMGFIKIIVDNRFTGKENKYTFSLDWRTYIPPPF